MKSRQNITIVLLLITAAILTAMIIGGYTAEQSYAASPDRRGNYIMITSSWSSEVDLVYIINIAAQRLNAYYYNANADNLDFIDSMDLRRLFPEQRDVAD